MTGVGGTSAASQRVVATTLPVIRSLSPPPPVVDTAAAIPGRLVVEGVSAGSVTLTWLQQFDGWATGGAQLLGIQLCVTAPTSTRSLDWSSWLTQQPPFSVAPSATFTPLLPAALLEEAAGDTGFPAATGPTCLYTILLPPNATHVTCPRLKARRGYVFRMRLVTACGCGWGPWSPPGPLVPTLSAQPPSAPPRPVLVVPMSMSISPLGQALSGYGAQTLDPSRRVVAGSSALWVQLGEPAWFGGAVLTGFVLEMKPVGGSPVVLQVRFSVVDANTTL